MTPHHRQALNPEQRRAVERTDGPVLILAGAGSGKTRTLVYRVAHLIRKAKVDPARIVAVTFTNRAAQEMRERVRDFAPDEARRVTISTFHSLGVRILREHGERLGLPRRFAIYSAADQLGALRSACAEISIDDDSFDLKRVLRRISDWKTRGVDPVDAVKAVAGERATGTRADDYAVLAADAYGRYEETLRACGAVDFDDLLLMPVRLLRADEDVRQALWKRWHYYMIDEYQDTNAVQLEMARLLAGPRRNLCVVGDDDQSIYAFRGADVGNILEFERHFPGAAVIRLEQNYRSTQRILAAANAVIAGNPHRHPKRLRTTNAVGAPIDLHVHAAEADEAAAVAREIQVRRMARKMRWEDFAVLYRTNPQARVLEEALRAQNIPYHVVGGTSFFDRKEVLDCLAWLRAVVAPGDEIALRRIINFPARGIGRTTVLKLVAQARDRRTGFGAVLATVTVAEMGAAPAAAVHAFNDLLRDLRRTLHAAEAAAAMPPPPGELPPLAAWAKELFRRIDIEGAVRAERRNDRTADARVENIRDLVGTIARYERGVWAEGPGGEDWSAPTLSDALARLTLSELDDDAEEGDGEPTGVTLMTLHSAKGLEFSDVFIVGLEEGILPHARSLAESGEAGGYADPLAEERRLLYVGLTRAQQRLALSYCLSRKRGGSVETVLPSRYLEEIPPDLLEVRDGGTSTLTEEESTGLREGFFSRMKEMLAD
ncbi:MAG TPA: UvrD-helicase domain-containing protein [Longimicrobiales bacterium]|nr:UvrD-helicase domain-containing protein [Longimicrobiales bacterium]